MFKGKLGLWVMILVGCLVIQFLIGFVPGLFQTTDVSIYADSVIDSDLNSKVNNKKVSDMTFQVFESDTDIIIKDNSTDKNVAGYTKYSEHFYSPLVLYFRNNMINKSEGFIKLEPSSQSSPYKVDFLSILQGMESKKTWKDLGFNPDVIKGEITLTIPNEYSPYYDSVVELFYLTLNEYKSVTEQDRARLEDRVNTLINKCSKVSDVVQVALNEYDKPSANYKVLIGPEFMYQVGGSAFSRNNSDGFVIIYPMKSINYSLDLFVKNIENRSDNKENLAASQFFLETIKNKEGFFKITGWRVKNSIWSIGDITSTYSKFVPDLKKE